jgi:protein phosphatase
LRSFGDVAIGAATHTGCVRRTNEDDYLVLFPEDEALLARRGRVLALADGMGGVTGGAEASRAAVRALAEVFLAEEPELDEAESRMRDGFRRACRRVWQQSRESPSLRGMGTTLTVLNLVDGKVVLGHVGDSRCYLLREGKLALLTQDHAMRGQENRLTRCVGGGRDTEDVDVTALEALPGDRFLLASDGLWDTVPESELRELLAAMEPQAAADEMVSRANVRGGPDNSTALVLRIEAVAANGDGRGELRDVALPAAETWRAPAPPRRRMSLRAPVWPWLLLAASAVLGALAVARSNGFDLLETWLARF